MDAHQDSSHRQIKLKKKKTQCQAIQSLTAILAVLQVRNLVKSQNLHLMSSCNNCTSRIYSKLHQSIIRALYLPLIYYTFPSTTITTRKQNETLLYKKNIYMNIFLIENKEKQIQLKVQFRISLIQNLYSASTNSFFNKTPIILILLDLYS